MGKFNFILGDQEQGSPVYKQAGLDETREPLILYR